MKNSDLIKHSKRQEFKRRLFVKLLIFITIIILLISNLSCGREREEEKTGNIAATLQPLKYIEVDTMIDGSYLVRFMKGEKVVKKLSLKMKFKEYKIDTTSVKVEHSAKINKKIYNIRTIQLVIDTIYLNPSLFTISSDKSKIAIRWENLIKRNYRKVEKIFELDTILYEGDHLIGLRSLSRIEVYNEDGKKQYEIEGSKEGWAETDDWHGDAAEEFLFKNIEGVKKYASSTSPYGRVVKISDSGAMIMTNSCGEGLLLKAIKVINTKGKVVLTERVRAYIKDSDFKEIGDKTYFLGTTKDGMELFIAGDKGVEKRITLTNKQQSGMGWMEEYYDGKVVVFVEKVDDIWGKNTKVVEKNMYIIDRNNEIEGELKLDVSKEGIKSGKLYWTGKEIIIWGLTEDGKDVKVYKLKENNELEEVKIEGEIGRYVLKVIKTDNEAIFVTVNSADYKEYKMVEYKGEENRMKGTITIQKEEIK